MEKPDAGAAKELSRDVLADMVRKVLEPFSGRATITIGEAATLLGVSRSTAFEAARRGELDTWRFGRRLVVPLPALAARLLVTNGDAVVAMLNARAGEP